MEEVGQGLDPDRMPEGVLEAKEANVWGRDAGVRNPHSDARLVSGRSASPQEGLTMAVIEDHELEQSSGKASLPTYHTIADVLEKRTGSGIKLVGWTFARAALIGVPMLIVKVEPKKALAGSLLASGFISLFAMLRIFNTHYELEKAYFDSRRWARRRRSRR